MRQRVLLLVVGALLPLVVLTAGFALFALRQQQDRLREEAAAHADAMLGRVERELDTQVELLRVLSRSPTLDGPKPELARFHEVASRFRAELPMWRRVILADPQGRQVVNTGVPFGTPLPMVVDAAGHRRLFAEGRPIIGNITGAGPLSTDPRPTFGIRVPVHRGGELVYSLVATVRTETLQNILGAVADTSFRAFLVDGADTIVAATASPGQTGQPVGPRAKAARAEGDRGVYDGATPGGQAVVTAFRQSATTGWSAHVAIPLEVYQAPIRRSLWTLGMAAVAALALTGLLVWLLRRELVADRRAAAARERSNRLEALGRMTGGVAHDINNLLMVVQGNAELAQQRLRDGRAADDPRVGRNLASILAAVEKGTRLTRDLLVFSRGGAGGGAVATFDPAARVRANLAMVRQSLRGDIAVETDLAEGLLITADAVQFDVALLNLAVNARDALPGKGTVRIAIHPVEGAHGRRVAVSMSDSGVGIPTETLPHVFEPFFTTKDVGKGSGLGLSQVYGFAKAAGGSADITSTPGAGTTVTLTLPATAPPPAAEAVPPADVASRPMPAARILLVDDNGDVRVVTAALLRESGLRVAEAADAAAALDRLAGGGVDVLVSDIRMPGALDGLALARAVRERHPGLPIILVSGYSDLTAEARASGFAVLAKPFDRPSLLTAIRGAVGAAPPCSATTH